MVRPQPPAARPNHVSVSLSTDDELVVARLIPAARWVVLSPSFARHMKDSKLSWLPTPTASQSMNGEEVWRIYTGASPDYQLPATVGYGAYSWLWGCLKKTAGTDMSSANGDATITLEGCVMDWAREAAVPEAFACAINTLAHEWSHTISRAGGKATGYVFQDGKFEANQPLVSYQVGAIAQCTYLEAALMIDANQFDNCVRQVVGPPFNSATCVHGWAGKLRHEPPSSRDVATRVSQRAGERSP